MESLVAAGVAAGVAGTVTVVGAVGVAGAIGVFVVANKVYDKYMRGSNGDAASPSAPLHNYDNFKTLKEALNKDTSGKPFTCTIEGTLFHHFEVEDTAGTGDKVLVKTEEFDTEMGKAIRRGMLGCCGSAVYPTNYLFEFATKVAFKSCGTASLKDGKIEFKLSPPSPPKVTIEVWYNLRKGVVPTLCVLGVVIVVILGVGFVILRRQQSSAVRQVQANNRNIF